MTLDPFAGVCAERLTAAPAHLFESAREQFLRPSMASERRGSPRFYIAVEAVARPLAADGTSAGEPFRGVVADLSNSGLRLLHCERLAAPLLAVRIGLWNDSVSVVLRIIRSIEHDSHCEHAGPFLAPLDLERMCDRIFELTAMDLS